MKNYDFLMKKINEGQKDEAPQWMDELFNKNFEKKNESKNPFANIDDPILNPHKKSIKKCSCCGMPLKINEIELCDNCCEKER